MSLPWAPVIFLDIAGSILMLLVSGWCASLSWQLTKKKPDDVFRSYLFLFTLAILFFAVSRSFGHLIKQLLLLNNLTHVWQLISPFSGAVNSTAFVVIFAFGISFYRFQRVHGEIEYYKSNLEELVEVRTEELEESRNTLENILNNSNPINITAANFDLLQANDAYYSIWPKRAGESEILKCYESRPGAHCHTEQCPLELIKNGQQEVTQEVSKEINGKVRDFIILARPFRGLDNRLIGMVESFQEITLRKQAERAMRESEERFRQIFESNPDPVILARLDDGEIIDVNKAFEVATGINRPYAIGHKANEIDLWVEKDFRVLFREQLKRQGEVFNYETTFHVVGGETKTGLISACIVNINDEACILLVIRDITTEKAAEEALVEMDRMKGEFISTAAHELNTPLTTMMGYAEFLRDPEEFGGFSDEQKHDFMTEIYDNGEALSRIVEDLLDISRIESGKAIPLVLENVDITDILARKVKSYRTHNVNHTFYLSLPKKPAKPKFIFDRHRISQALENLLSNAVKYSPADTTIHISGRELEKGWEITVEDQGIGMNDDQLEKVFDKFFRADASNTAIKGLGLGMSIVKQIIETHGGWINVESTEGQGTKVTFLLPYEVEAVSDLV